MNEIITLENQAMGVLRDTSLVLEEAKNAAKNLAAVIKGKAKPVIFNGEQYLEFEDWQAAGQFYGYSVKTGDANSVEIDGIKGARAKAELFDRDGRIVGGAESFCMRDEQNWRNKPWFQLASMAQTRAASKALRNRLAWFVVLAGFKATPADEMERTETVAVIPKSAAITVSENSKVSDILSMLVEMNNGDEDAVAEHLHVLTAWKDKATGKEKWLTVSSLNTIAKDWLDKIHLKTISEYNRRTA